MNYGGGDHEMSYGGMASAGIDNALEAGLGGQGDGESRDKAKVIYTCGGKYWTQTQFKYRLRQGECSRQRLCHPLHQLWAQDLLQEEREEDHSVLGKMSLQGSLPDSLSFKCLLKLI